MDSVKHFPEETWHELVSTISSSFSMNSQRRRELLNTPTAKLIAAIPFLAGCREPKRTALAHLGTYLIASTKAGEAIFDHNEGDDKDPFARLATIANFEGGDPAVIDRGMKLLAYTVIAGYERDIDYDTAKGLYNPIAAGQWNADDMLSSLMHDINEVKNEEMDVIMEINRLPQKGPWWMSRSNSLLLLPKNYSLLIQN